MAIAYAALMRFLVRMVSSLDILERVLDRFPLPSDVFAPEGRFWLTLYLFGDPASYEAARSGLEAGGWMNLCRADEFAGFSYPKKEVRNDVGQVREALRSALEICDGTGMGIGVIDADTAFDPEKTTFRTLYRET